MLRNGIAQFVGSWISKSGYRLQIRKVRKDRAFVHFLGPRGAPIARACKVCKHQKREAIERAWISWGDTTQIARDYKVSRNSVYRHAEMMGLFQKRDRNLRTALGRIIEKAGSVDVTSAAVVSAVQAYAKINGTVNGWTASSTWI